MQRHLRLSRFYITLLMFILGTASSMAQEVGYVVGEIPVEGSVSPTGARIYTVPVMTAPGVSPAPQISHPYMQASEYDEYPYPTNMQIICSQLDDGPSAFQSIIAAGEGLKKVDVVDINGDGQDEIVKINSRYVDGNKTEYAITVYSFDHSFTRHQYEFSIRFDDSFFPDASSNRPRHPARSHFLFGNFRGDGKNLLLII